MEILGSWKSKVQRSRERERGEEQWRCKVAPCGYRGVNHITPVRRGAPSILRFTARVEICYVILNAQNDPLAFSDRERLECILLEMNVNEGVEEGGGLESRNEATT